MELRNRTTGAVITESQFRADNKNTSFPEVLTTEIITDFGYDPVLEGPQATTVPPYQYSQRDGVVKVGTQWFTKYVAITPDDDGKARMDAAQAQVVRSTRNKRLSDCDWTQLADAPGQTRSAWVQYRQDLRNIPQQSGFPWEITWPTEP